MEIAVCGMRTADLWSAGFFLKRFHLEFAIRNPKSEIELLYGFDAR